jgi:hypothetical protein
MMLGACCLAGHVVAQDPVHDGFSEQRRMEADIRTLLRTIDAHSGECFEELKDSMVVQDRGWTANWKMPGSLGAAILRTDTALVYRTITYAEDPLEGFLLMKNAGFYNRDVNGKSYRYQNFFEWEHGAQYRLVHSDDEYFAVEYFKKKGYVQIDFVLARCALPK